MNVMSSLLLTVVATVLGVKWFRASTSKVTRALCLSAIVWGGAGTLLNTTVILANGNRMPVLVEEADWNDAPEIFPNGAPGCGLLRWSARLGIASATQAEPDDGKHVRNPARVRFPALADVIHVKLCGIARASYSIGDACVRLGDISIVLLALHEAARYLRRARGKTQDHPG